MSTVRDEIYRAHSYGQINYEEMARRLKEINEHDECVSFTEPVLDDLECSYRDCLVCHTRYWACAFCEADDILSEEELNEHLEARHQQEICEHSPASRSGRHFHICEDCGFEFDPPEHDEF